MVTDVPPTVTTAGGQKFCPWQQVWLDGLKALHHREVYVMSLSSEKFKSKFENHALFLDHDENMRACSFDAGYDLPDPERAVSIMDWERRQLLRVAAANNLTILHLTNSPSCISRLDQDRQLHSITGKGNAPFW